MFAVVPVPIRCWSLTYYEFKSRLLVTNSSDVEFLHIYEAQITSELLEWLDHPVTSTEFTGAPIIVKRRKIPFKPFGNFVRRIVYELLGPGHWNQTSTPQTENDATLAHSKASKRKREDDGSLKRSVRPRS
jgi:hypothetical protein